MSCPRCQTDNKTKNRSFSEKAIAALVSWGELDESLVDQPICDDCYEELREALIDGESEVAASHSKAS